jgi:hypothetical protein
MPPGEMQRATSEGDARHQSQAVKRRSSCVNAESKAPFVAKTFRSDLRWTAALAWLAGAFPSVRSGFRAGKHYETMLGCARLSGEGIHSMTCIGPCTRRLVALRAPGTLRRRFFRLEKRRVGILVLLCGSFLQ